MKRKMIVTALCFALTLSISACGAPSTKKPIETTPPVGASQAQPEETVTGAAAVTIQADTVLLNQDGLVITAKEMVEDSIWGLGVKVLIENQSDKNLGVQCNSLIVNNYMLSDLFSATVAAGKKSNETIYLSSAGLEAADITTIAEIVFSFHVFDSNSYQGVFDTDEIQLKTSAYGTVEQPAMDDGKELFNQDGIRIIGRYVEEDSFWGAGVLLYIENNYGKNILVQCDNLSINGFMVMPVFSCGVNNGRMALDDITIMSSDLEENGIETVEDIELTFKIIDPNTYQTLIETNPIAFSAA